MTQPLTILITGASSGFGEATARLLATGGHQLVLVARRKDRLEKIAAELEAGDSGARVHVAACDVTDAAQIECLFAELPAQFAGIDVLINSAGLALGMGPAQDSDLAEWNRMVDTNIKGLMTITHHALPGLTKRGSGLIVNLGSAAAFMPYRGGNVYGGTKAFVRQFSRGLRTDLLGTGVKVTNIEPAMAETEFSVVRYGDAVQAKAYYDGMHPLSADDIARTIAWVIDQPAHVNIDNVEVWPLDQTYGGTTVHRATTDAS
jgi:3-hydroxy acid dehydrogenase/malonic semialdehyde reductase